MRHPDRPRPLRRRRRPPRAGRPRCSGSTARTFGKTDPQFDLDISFYLFELPFYRGVVGFASAVVLHRRRSPRSPPATSTARIRVSGREVRISQVRAHPARRSSAALYLLLQAVSIWLDQYATLTDADSSDLITGAAYTDVNAVIPGRAILAGIAAVVAVLFIVTAVIGRWRCPLVGTALLIVAASLIGVDLPVDRRSASRSSRARRRSRRRTSSATSTRPATRTASPTSTRCRTTRRRMPSRRSCATTPRRRRTSASSTPRSSSDTFAQLEQFKQYYQFPTHLDVDRYTIDGKTQDTVIAVRELEPAAARRRQQLVQQHRSSTPTATASSPPTATSARPTASRCSSSRASRRRARSATSSRASTSARTRRRTRSSALRRAPRRSSSTTRPATSSRSQNATTTFTGNGGPKLDNVFKRLVYAIKFQSEQILLSDAVNDDSQILYDRDPQDARAEGRAVPDARQRPVPGRRRRPGRVDRRRLHDERRVPVLDDVEQLSDAIADTNTPTPRLRARRHQLHPQLGQGHGRRVRRQGHAVRVGRRRTRSCKTWEKIFPSTVKPMSDDERRSCSSHVRYPADLFKVQRAILGTYHVTDADSFYSGDDAWTTPNDPTQPKATADAAAAVLPDDADAGRRRSRRSRCTRPTSRSRARTSRSNVLTGYSRSTRMPDAGQTRLRQAHAADLPEARHGARPRPGAEQLQLRSRGRQPAHPAAAGRHEG